MLLKRLKSEKGSITVIVLSTMLVVVAVIFVYFFSMMNKNSSQAKELEKIEKEYIQSDSMMEQVYDGIDKLEDIKGVYFAKDTLLTIEGNKVLIPGGATVSGLDDECSSVNGGETSKDGGIVIYITKGEEITNWEQAKTKYDQFVWIPVEKAYVTVDEIGEDSIDNLKNYIKTNGVYPMAIKISEDEYKGVLYDFDDSTGTLTITPYDYNTTSSYRESDVVSFDSSNGVSEETLQTDFNTMVTKVDENGGFWVGRYETTNLSSSNVTVIKGTTTGINNVTWYNMYKNQKNYASTEFSGSTPTITSSMIWGSQWDQIMLWMKGVPSELTNGTYTGSYYVTNAVGMGNYGEMSGVNDGSESTSSPASTGFSENFKVKNVYDLAGNVFDWTLEAYSANNRVKRRRLLW